MKELPDIYKNPCPDLKQRQRSPHEAAEYWSRDGWAAWLKDGIYHAQFEDGQVRLTAFAPFLIDRDNCTPVEVFHILEDARVSEAARSLMESALAYRIRLASWGDNQHTVSFLITMAGYAKTSAPREALVTLFDRPCNLSVLEKPVPIADAVAFVLSRHSNQFDMEKLITGNLRPLLSTTPSACILAAAAHAFRRPETFVPNLRSMAPHLFEQPTTHRDWRFTVNQLTTYAGAEKAVCAAEGSDDAAQKLRDALRIFGGSAVKACTQ